MVVEHLQDQVDQEVVQVENHLTQVQILKEQEIHPLLVHLKDTLVDLIQHLEEVVEEVVQELQVDLLQVETE